MKIHHIAYSVTDIEEAREIFSFLGYVPEGEIVDDVHRNVKILFMISDDKTRIELVEPLNDSSPVASRLLESRGVSSPYHICYETNNMEASLESLMSRGVVPISDISPAPAIGGRRVCFAFGKASGLIELVEAE